MLSKPYPLITLALALAGAFVVVSTFAFAQSTANSIDFAIAIGVTVLGLAGLVSSPSEHSHVHRAIAGGVVALGAWTILVTLGIFSGTTQEWIVFGAGAATAAAGLAGHGLYETGRERRLTRLEAGPSNGSVSVEGRSRVPATA